MHVGSLHPGKQQGPFGTRFWGRWGMLCCSSLPRGWAFPSPGRDHSQHDDLGLSVCWRAGVSCWWGTAGSATIEAPGEPFSQGEAAADFSSLLSRPFVLISQSTKGIEQAWEYVWKNISPSVLHTEEKEYVTVWLLYQSRRDKTTLESSFFIV